MKYETLLKRYTNLGYTPIPDLDRDLQIANIIKWIYQTYNIYVFCNYMTMRMDWFKQFTGASIMEPNEDHNSTVYCMKHFDSPYDALYDAVRDIYRHLRFRTNGKTKLW